GSRPSASMARSLSERLASRLSGGEDTAGSLVEEAERGSALEDETGIVVGGFGGSRRAPRREPRENSAGRPAASARGGDAAHSQRLAPGSSLTSREAGDTGNAVARFTPGKMRWSCRSRA